MEHSGYSRSLAEVNVGATRNACKTFDDSFNVNQHNSVKPDLKHLSFAARESFLVRSVDEPYYPTWWHFHPEYELVLVTESTGKRVIGDTVSAFNPGDLVLLGPNLPHLYQNDIAYYDNSSALRAKSIIVQFSEKTFGLNVPETNKFQNLFHQAQSGINITGNTNKKVSAQLSDLLKLSGLPRWLKLLEILHTIVESADYELICGNINNTERNLDADRLLTIVNFVQNRFKEDIYAKDIAQQLGMTSTSFSRYFSQRTQKSFARFVVETRLNYACNLLIESSMSISEICFACGFKNVSNFNRQFSKVYQSCPLAYRKGAENRTINHY
jgi:AraC-like DNA-binding protein